MRVTLMVDALSPQLSGIGRYCWELAKGLPAARGVDTVRYRLNAEWVRDPARMLDPKAGAIKQRPRWLRPLTEIRDKSWIATSVVHGPNYFLPRKVERGIITVHDLSVFRFPETHPAARLREFEREFQSSLARASHIITDTEAVRTEVIEAFGTSPDAITAIPLGHDPAFHPRDHCVLEHRLAEFGLSPGQYTLCVSAFEPRKKIGNLIQAYRLLDTVTKRRYPLVLVGPIGWLNAELADQVAIAEAEGWLKSFGYVTEKNLPLLYAGAHLFAYPSSYEGFGLPPLEAMASGVPVLVAEQPCAREICGEAAHYVDPDDMSQFSETLREALANSGIRQQRVAIGLEISAGFSWERCIAQTAELYHRIGP